ncbi:MAG TPA: four helix bundle protein, partial [Bacteroidota bacterium]
MQKEKVATAQPEDIRKRTFRFAVTIVKLSGELGNDRAANVIAKQIIRSGTSIGANAQEAVAAHSKQDFIYKTNIALREARETLYWLKLIQELSILKPSTIQTVLQEAEEITKILGAIVSTARGVRKTTS